MCLEGNTSPHALPPGPVPSQLRLSRGTVRAVALSPAEATQGAAPSRAQPARRGTVFRHTTKPPCWARPGRLTCLAQWFPGGSCRGGIRLQDAGMELPAPCNVTPAPSGCPGGLGFGSGGFLFSARSLPRGLPLPPATLPWHLAFYGTRLLPAAACNPYIASAAGLDTGSGGSHTPAALTGRQGLGEGGQDSPPLPRQVCSETRSWSRTRTDAGPPPAPGRMPAHPQRHGEELAGSAPPAGSPAPPAIQGWGERSPASAPARRCHDFMGVESRLLPSSGVRTRDRTPWSRG